LRHRFNFGANRTIVIAMSSVPTKTVPDAMMFCTGCDPNSGIILKPCDRHVVKKEMKRDANQWTRLISPRKAFAFAKVSAMRTSARSRNPILMQQRYADFYLVSST
jgi:hypothetical protein